MNFNTSNYFTYKKNKMQSDLKNTNKPISKLSFLFQLFLATFIIMFILIVISIMKYSSKMDIEYTKGDLSLHNSSPTNSISGYSYPAEDIQRKIDKRLILIQQEENAPSEAKIIADKTNNPEVIDYKYIENNKKLEKLEKLEIAEKENQAFEKRELAKILSAFDEKVQDKTVKDDTLDVNKNITIMSKVLIGRYSTFEEAQKVQNEIKTKDPTLSPFVRKVGDVFSVQMGSYKDFDIAKKQAQLLKFKGFDVWIYQQ